MIYLDSAATTPVCPQAIQAALEAMTEIYGNPSSRHAQGSAAAALVRESRERVAAALGCESGEVYFTSGGTEGDNWAIRGSAALGGKRGRHIITTAIEHSAVLEPCRALEREGWEVTYLRPDPTGHIPLPALEAALRPDTVLVSMMLVNNELGTLQDVAGAARLLRERESSALLHTDAVQGFLKLPFTPKELGVDLLTVSGHKIGAPKGIGALYIRKGLRFPPLLLGGGQEEGERSGTEPTSQIAALAAACAAWREEDRETLRERKEEALTLLKEVPGLHVVSPGDAPHILAVSLPGFPSEMLVRALSDAGICVSSGSACHKGKPSHVFAALGLEKRVLMGVLRISLSPTTQAADLAELKKALIAITRERVSL